MKLHWQGGSGIGGEAVSTIHHNKLRTKTQNTGVNLSRRDRSRQKLSMKNRRKKKHLEPSSFQEKLSEREQTLCCEVKQLNRVFAKQKVYFHPILRFWRVRRLPYSKAKLDIFELTHIISITPMAMLNLDEWPSVCRTAFEPLFNVRTMGGAEIPLTSRIPSFNLCYRVDRSSLYRSLGLSLPAVILHEPKLDILRASKTLQLNLREFGGIHWTLLGYLIMSPTRCNTQCTSICFSSPYSAYHKQRMRKYRFPFMPWLYSILQT